MDKGTEPTAEYTKLPDGSWAVWVKGVIPRAGDVVRVRSWDGTVTNETIRHVLWREEDGAFCTIHPWKRANGALRGRCGNCNSVELWAFYPRYERQSILVEILDGLATYEYSGKIVPADSDPRSGELFFCSGCGMTAPSVKRLVGLQDDDAWFGGQGLQGDYYAMSSIHSLLDHREWSLETLQEIAAIVVATGRPFRAPEGSP